jgi:hypothetical protein
MATGINHYIHYLSLGSESFSRRSGVKFDIDKLLKSVVSALKQFDAKLGGSLRKSS